MIIFQSGDLVICDSGVVLNLKTVDYETGNIEVAAHRLSYMYREGLPSNTLTIPELQKTVEALDWLVLRPVPEET